MTTKTFLKNTVWRDAFVRERAALDVKAGRYARGLGYRDGASLVERVEQLTRVLRDFHERDRTVRIEQEGQGR